MPKGKKDSRVPETYEVLSTWSATHGCIANYMHGSLCPDTLFHVPTGPPRAYPEGFAENLRRAFEQHLVSPALRDLRFKVEFDKHLSARDQFTNMPMGNDLWLDANLLEPLEYVMTSKYLRIQKTCWTFIMYMVFDQLASLHAGFHQTGTTPYTASCKSTARRQRFPRSLNTANITVN